MRHGAYRNAHDESTAFGSNSNRLLQPYLNPSSLLLEESSENKGEETFLGRWPSSVEILGGLILMLLHFCLAVISCTNKFLLNVNRFQRHSLNKNSDIHLVVVHLTSCENAPLCLLSLPRLSFSSSPRPCKPIQKWFYLRDESVTAEVISWHSEIEEENK
mmetsp:Transcript_20484/g.31219  ORF Transcript_20484/g.31219 Transcript_20484/m.31219 type:complete len:160 (+) Transcript_20484:498-977(+)